MSVLIKGMEIPKNCDVCPLQYHDNEYGIKFCSRLKDESNMISVEYLIDYRLPNCPISEIPTPHGRLIDASQFEVFGYDAIEGSFDDGVTFVLNKIDDAPTVIEEEE